jgi:hypothetical protein
MKRLYFVSEGPDSRHFLFVTSYDLFRSAKHHYEQSDHKAKKLHSLDFEPFCNGTNTMTRFEQFA